MAVFHNKTIYMLLMSIFVLNLHSFSLAFAQGQEQEKAWNGVLKDGRIIGENYLKSLIKKHNKWLRSIGKEGARADLSGAMLQGVVLRRLNLQGANLSEVNLQGANLSGVNLQGANLIMANLQEARIENSNCQGALFVFANLQDVNFDDVDLREADFSGASFQNAHFCEANIQGAYFRETNFEGAKFQEANFEGAMLTGTNFRGACLEKANFQKINLFAPWTTNYEKRKIGDELFDADYWENSFPLPIEFREAAAAAEKAYELIWLSTPLRRLSRLIEVNVRSDIQTDSFRESIQKKAANFESELKELNFENADLRNANLEGANLRAVNLQGASLMEAYLQNADLSEANLNEANLYKANIRSAILFMANLQKADLTETDLQQSDLSLANLKEANLLGACLENADLSFANLQGAILIRTNLEGAFLESNLKGAIFEIVPGKLPDIPTSANASILSKIKYEQSPHGLIELRGAFKNFGFRHQERELTYAINHTALVNDFRSEGSKNADTREIERLIGYEVKPDTSKVFRQIRAALGWLFFDITCKWGMEPGRPIMILIGLIFICMFPYSHAISGDTSGRKKKIGIWRIWSKEPIYQCNNDGGPKILDSLDGIYCFKMGLYFSLLSAFNIGWQDLTVGSWISRIQPFEFSLKPSGWIRTVSGLQSLIGVYLLALWVLTYFGRPFESY